MMHHHAAAFRAAPADLQPAIATLALRMALKLPPAPLAIAYHRPAVPAREPMYCDPARVPPYPNLGATVAKLRRASDKPTREHGLAVLEAIGALNRQALRRAYAPPPCPCVSGTYSSDPDKILAAVRGKIAAEHARAAARDRAWMRDPTKARKRYAEAMAETRKARAAAKRKATRELKEAA